MFFSTGKLIYDPSAKIKKEPFWLIVKTGEEIIRYYQHQIKQQFDVSFQKTVWGSHISVVTGTKPIGAAMKESYTNHWNKYQKERITFQYTNKIYRAFDFYFVPVICPRLSEIRMELGLSPEPKHGFHLTVGRIDKVYFLRKQQKLEQLAKKIKLPTISHNKNLYPLIHLNL